ncbi:hypothetical protein [Patulibacter minatonensis]|uniref:hypothetical protein n=1 Tax=Patulibacter minatonensis TaxID=298163 RepID=UPI00047B7E7A|nr:hypothetical protein [Patulibacter minatonensis]
MSTATRIRIVLLLAVAVAITSNVLRLVDGRPLNLLDAAIALVLAVPVAFALDRLLDAAPRLGEGDVAESTSNS